MPSVEWKPIEGYEGIYTVSAEGVVRSLQRIAEPGSHGRNKTRDLKSAYNSSGYALVVLNKNGVRSSQYVHRLVLEAFIGPCPWGLEACHGNGNRKDNRAANLRWDTAKANCADRSKHGNWAVAKGEHCYNAVLTEEDVKQILRATTNGDSAQTLAKQYSVSKGTIYDIRQGRRWKHITQKAAR